MATAGRLMARRMRGRGHSPAASGVYLVGRSRTRPGSYNTRFEFCGVEFLLRFAALNLAAWFRARVCVALVVCGFCVHEKQYCWYRLFIILDSFL